MSHNNDVNQVNHLERKPVDIEKSLPLMEIQDVETPSRTIRKKPLEQHQKIGSGNSCFRFPSSFDEDEVSNSQPSGVVTQSPPSSSSLSSFPVWGNTTTLVTPSMVPSSLALPTSRMSTRGQCGSIKINHEIVRGPYVEGHWTYQKLIECRSLQKLIAVVSGKLRSHLADLHQESREPLRFQVLCMVDDSYSMTRFENQMKEALVLLVEVLRHFEFAFAVGRFSGTRDAELLKGFGDSFDLNLGEQILEKLNCKGKGTCPADALKSFLVDDIWGTQSSHRLVIMLTDGLTTQVNANVYRTLCHDFHETKLIPMVLLNRADCNAEDIDFRNSLTQAGIEVEIVDIQPKSADDDFSHDELCFRLVAVLKKFLKQISSMLATDTPQQNYSYAFSTELNPMGEVDKTNKIDLAKINEDLDFKSDLKSIIAKSASSLVTSFYSVSPQMSMSRVETTPNLDDDGREVRMANLEKNRAILMTSLARSLIEMKRISEAHLNWTKAQHHMSPQITDLTQVLEESVFPFNAYTRRKGALRGDSLYTPGLMKAFATDFHYRKYFASLSAGGKRSYSVVIAVDCSLSIQSFTSKCVIQSLFLLVCALHNIEVEFSVITFGEKVRLLKDSRSEWDSTHSWNFLNQLTFEESSSLDADAINCGIDLLMSTRCHKTLFVLTDGYGTSGRRLPAALLRADREKVEVIAIAVGMDQFGVSHSYDQWVECSLPQLLPEALEAFYRLDERPNTNNEGRKLQQFFLSAGSDLSIQEILRQHIPAFNFSKEMGDERDEFKIAHHEKAPDLTVDICFLTDLTGSMTPYASGVFSQIQKIIEGIKSKAQSKYPGVGFTLRVAFVGYKDNPCSRYEQWTMQFTDNLDTASTVMETLLKEIGGGGDIPEDVNGGLSAALRLDWKSFYKSLFLITDAPGHGRDMNDGTVSDDWERSAGPRDHVAEMIQRDIKFFFCRINKTATARMERHFSYLYDDPTKGREMVVMPIFKELPTLPDTVVIFCLDESHSMSSRFDLLQKEYKSFISQFEKKQNNSRIAIINFSSEARWIVGPEPKSVARAPRTVPCEEKQGTDFLLPIKKAAEVMDHPSCHGSHFVLLFVTDGRGGKSYEPAKLRVEQLALMYRSRFRMFTIGVGSTGDEEMLNTLAKKAGGNYRHHISRNASLFHEILSSVEQAPPIDLFDGIESTIDSHFALDYL
jgi:hypothetical protein